MLELKQLLLLLGEEEIVYIKPSWSGVERCLTVVEWLDKRNHLFFESLVFSVRAEDQGVYYVEIK